MKSYLSLIPISARVRRRQSRMTVLCIVIAVFLVTAIFSMADMAIRMESRSRLEKDGSWHLMLSDISEETAEEISRRGDIAVFTPYRDLNSGIDQDYFVNGKPAAICGAGSGITKLLPGFQSEAYPGKDEVILTANVQSSMDVDLGSTVTLTMPGGKTKNLTVVGFNQDTALAAQYDAVILYTNLPTFEEIQNVSGAEGETQYYLQFKAHTNLRKATDQLKEQYDLPDSSLSENTYLLALSLSSENSYILGLYAVAAVLAGMVLLAGIIMITASLNSTVSQRTRFYGMLRCLGAGKGQVRQLVRLEALNWCKTAVPLGSLMGIAATWGLCFFLRAWVSSEFNSLPLWEISPVGIVAGGVIGIATVWLASSAPAKRASSVTPVEAVSGSFNQQTSGALLGRGKLVDISLGVSHALGSKKTMLLMMGSFALSMVLFLCFFALLNWVNQALNPLKPYTPDISLVCGSEEESFRQEVLNALKEHPAVKRAYGRMYRQLPATYQGKAGKIDLISYDAVQFQWAKRELVLGNLPPEGLEEGLCVLSVFDKSNSLTVGDRIRLDGAELTICGVLDDSPFDSNDTPIIICSEAVFQYLLNRTAYRVIDIQLVKNATDEDISALRAMLDRTVSMDYSFQDRRETNQMVTSTYWAFTLFVYAFLLIISLIAMLNIANSISLSVTARIRQYGIMRAIGMDGTQITRVIGAEAALYGLGGILLGCLIGLPLYNRLYDLLITHYFGIPCKTPWPCLAICCAMTLLSVCLAVYAPAKRIRNMPITATINEL